MPGRSLLPLGQDGTLIRAARLPAACSGSIPGAWCRPSPVRAFAFGWRFGGCPLWRLQNRAGRAGRLGRGSQVQRPPAPDVQALRGQAAPMDGAACVPGRCRAVVGRGARSAPGRGHGGDVAGVRSASSARNAAAGRSSPTGRTSTQPGRPGTAATSASRRPGWSGSWKVGALTLHPLLLPQRHPEAPGPSQAASAPRRASGAGLVLLPASPRSPGART